METALERFLASSWQDILGVERVGVHDNFFELGGDSMQGVIFLNRLQQELGEVVSMATIFEVPTIAGLAVHLNQHYPDAVARLCGAEAPNGAEGGAQAGSAPTASERVGYERPATLSSDDFDEGRL